VRAGKVTKYDNARSKAVLGVEYTDLKQVRPTQKVYTQP
jgi:hypothetical protein